MNNLEQVLMNRVKAAFTATGLTQKEFCKDFNEWNNSSNPTINEELGKDYSIMYLRQGQLSKIFNGNTNVPMLLITFFVNNFKMDINYFLGKSFDMFIQEKEEEFEEEVYETSLLDNVFSWLSKFKYHAPIIILLFISLQGIGQEILPNQREINFSFTKSSEDLVKYYYLNDTVNASLTYVGDNYWNYIVEDYGVPNNDRCRFIWFPIKNGVRFYSKDCDVTLNWTKINGTEHLEHIYYDSVTRKLTNLYIAE